MRIKVKDLHKGNIGQVAVVNPYGIFGTLTSVAEPSSDGEFPDYAVTIGATKLEMAPFEDIEVFRSSELALLHRREQEDQQHGVLFDKDVEDIEEIVASSVEQAIGRLIATLSEAKTSTIQAVA